MDPILDEIGALLVPEFVDVRSEAMRRALPERYYLSYARRSTPYEVYFPVSTLSGLARRQEGSRILFYHCGTSHLAAMCECISIDAMRKRAGRFLFVLDEFSGYLIIMFDDRKRVRLHYRSAIIDIVITDETSTQLRAFIQDDKERRNAIFTQFLRMSEVRLVGSRDIMD